MALTFASRTAKSVQTACALTLAACALPIAGEVVEVRDDGFVSAFEVEIKAPPKRTFDALWKDVSKWWDPAHTYTDDSENMYFSDLIGFVEDLSPLVPSDPPEGERRPLFDDDLLGPFVRHMDIDMVQPPTALRLRGAMGPLQTLAVMGSMTFDLEATEDGTRLRYRYVVNGPRLREWAEPVDRVMGGQLQRLRRYVESGDPAPPEEEP